jgi:putative membrane protein
LSVTASAQTPNPSNSNTNQSNPNTSQSTTSQSSQSSTTSSTDSSSTPASQSTQTDTSTSKSRSKTTGSTADSNTSGTQSSSRNRTTVDTEKSMIGEKDHKFLTKASEGGLMEVQMAQAAQQKASSQAVKDFARQLEQDHTAANKQLADISTQRNVSLPTTPMANDHQQTMDKLNKLSGAEFDKQYIKMMIRDHKKDIKEFESEANNGMDTSLKNFASSTLPTLRNHLQMAEQIDKGGSATSTKASTTSDANSSSASTTTNESTRSRTKDSAVVEDKSTINKVTPAPSSSTTTQTDQTTTNSDGTVKQDSTTINKTTTKP